MQTLYSKIMYMAVQQRDIAITYKPFRTCFKSCPVNTVYNTHSTIPPFGKKNSFYRGIIKHLLKIGQTLCIGTRKKTIRFKNILSQYRFKSPAFQQGESVVYFVRFTTFCGTNNSDFIAGGKVWWWCH